jgi:acrosin
LLSTINWTNRVVSDNFGIYGANTAVARTIVDRAIADWERIIVDFNYSGGGNTYNLTLSAGPISGRGVTGSITRNNAVEKKPTSAVITIDDDAQGGGWYFDPVIGTSTVPDDGEFTTLLSPFAAQNAVTDNDFYRTVVHEIGHAMGILDSSGFLKIGDFLSNGPADPNNASETLRLLNFNGGAVDYTLTTDGGGHMFEGGGAYAGPIHPNDLMNDGRTVALNVNRRQLISDDDAFLLRDVYGYTIATPHLVNTFYANLNTSTNIVTVTGDANPNGSDVDTIDLEVDGTAMSFEVNGTDEVIEGAQFTTIVVNAGSDNDDVDVDELLASKSVTVNGGDGNDNISAAQELQDIDTDLDSNFTANGNAGTDTLVFNDQADAVGGDDYTFTNTTFTKNASFIDRVITYGTFESLIVNGSSQASTYDVNTLLTNLTINAGAANDTIDVGGANADIDSWIIADVIVHGNGGTDSLTFNDASDTLNDSYTLTSVGFDKSTTTTIFGFDTVENLTLIANPDNNVIDVLSASGISTDLNTLTVNGSGGNDSINLGSGDLEIDLAFTAVTVNGGAGDDSLYLDDSDDAEFDGDSYTITSTTFDKNTAGLNLVTFNTMEDVVLDCGIVDNTVNIDSFSTQVAADLQTLLVNGNAGDDTFNLGVGDLETNLAFTAVSVNGNGGTDLLVANDGGDGEGADDYTITSTTLDKNTAGLTNPITYGTFENVNLTCNTFDNLINVPSTLSGCTYTASGNTGNDVFNIGSPGNNADNIDGVISLSGGGGTDAYNYNDSANAVAQTYTVSLNNVLRTGTAGTVYTTMESLTLNCGAGADTINVPSTLGGILTVVNGDGGNDTMVATTTGDWDAFINGNLTFNGNANTDTLRINDTADVGADNYTVTSTQTTKTSIASVISYATIENYTLDANGDINTITVNSSFAAPFRVHGNGGVDTINLVDNAAGSFVTIDGGAGLDNVTVNSDAAGTATAHFDVTQDLAALTILGGGTAVMELNGSRVIDTDALTVAATGKLDLTDNDLIVDYAGASQLAVVQVLINLGRNGGAWNGNGITSSAAAANAQHNTTLGAMEASEFQSIYGVGATFDGRIIDSSAVLVKYTYYGDADFNGQVNFDDYVRTDNGFNNHLNHWVNGDYDGNGSVNFDDYVLIDLAFNTQSGTL